MTEYLTARASGTSNSHQRVRPQDFLDFKWVQPAVPVREAFTELVMPLFERIANTRRETATLAALRDTLLPKLLNGELSLVRSGILTEATE